MFIYENKCLYIYSIKNRGMNTWGAQLKKVKTKAFNVPRSRLYGQTAFLLWNLVTYPWAIQKAGSKMAPSQLSFWKNPHSVLDVP